MPVSEHQISFSVPGRASLFGVFCCFAVTSDTGPLCHSPQAAATPEYASGRVIVRFKSGTVIAQNVDQLGMTFDKPFGVQGGAVYNIADGSSVEEKVAELNALNAVEFAEPDYRVRLSRTPNDAQYAQQWHHPVIGSPNAWDSVTGSASIGVCIVDSGVRKNHPDLAGSIAGGWNLVPAIQKDGQPPPTPSDPAYTAYDDKVGHGTHVAGIVAAIGNNSRGVAGVAWKVRAVHDSARIAARACLPAHLVQAQ